MSNLWRTGFDPEHAGRGLRGIGLFVILIAFLVASNRFVSGDEAKPTSTTPARPPVVVADSALASILPRIDSKPRFTFAATGTAPPATGATSPAGTTTATTAPNAVVAASAVPASDVVITADTDLMTKLVAAKQCAPPVTIGTDPATRPPRAYLACAVLHGGQVRPSAQTFIGELTSLKGRVVLVDAGFDLPARTS